MVQNARYGESFSESFEDYNYAETLNKAKPYTCTRNYVDFNGQYGGSIIPNNSAVSAHSGKYMLKVNSNAQLTKTFNTGVNIIDDFSLVTNPDTTMVLNDPGANSTFGPPLGDPLYLWPPTINFNQQSVNVTLDFSVSTTNNYTAATSFDFYIDISVAKMYKFQMNLYPELQRDLRDCLFYSNGISATITNLSGTFTKHLDLSTQDKTTSVNALALDSAFLCPGIYKVQGSAFQQYANTTNPQDGYNSYSIGFADLGSLFYKSLSKQGGCIYTKPIASTDSMFNPMFSLVPGKRMQFSAWVHEDCGVPCFKSDFDKSNIEIWSGGNNLGLDKIKRTGAIIEGWQKIEGEFTVPVNATTAELRFINTNDAPMYVDDIRIHPFNANMKSYVYDPRTLRLSAELDENNYASFYEYDEEGQLIRAKKETIQGIKTIKETRNAKQRGITELVD
jgi:hypothetical protein